MAFPFTARYERDVEERMQGFYQTLSEKDRACGMRRSRHGNWVVAAYPTLPKCWMFDAPSDAASELDNPNDPAAGRIRRPGGGRKRSIRGHNSNTI